MSEQLIPPAAPAAPIQPAPVKSNGLATAGFVLAVVAVVLCLVPIVNNVAFVLGALGLIFGIVGVVKARHGAPRKGMAVAAIVLSVLAGAGVLGSQAMYGKALDEVSDALDDTPTVTASADTARADADAARSGDSTTAEQGTRQNPYPAGTTVSNDDWDLTVGEPREAWAEIKKANMFNTPPAKGTEFWIVPLKGTYKGADAMAPWVDLSVRFVGDDNVTYDGTDCGVTPHPMTEVGELYAGGTFEAGACVAVPKGAPGLFTVTAGLLSDPVFFGR